MLSIYGKKVCARKIFFCVGLVAGCSAAAVAADTITGVARNQTRGGFAIGDEVILLRLDQSVHEEARTKTDPRGSFTLQLKYPHSSHLVRVVRVVHQGVNYDQPASAGDAVSLDVFDAATRVQGVTGTIEIIRIGTVGNLLHVSDMIELKNDSSPPLTQAGERSFEVFLPAHAKIDSVLAAGPAKIGTLISATPVLREAGHYTVNFPLRPGATKFAFNYNLPYEGHATFHPRSAYPLQQFAVMIAAAMKFASSSSAFQVLPTGNNNYQVNAASQVMAGEGPWFKISGVGALPALPSQNRSLTKPPVAALAAPVSSAADRRSGGRVQGTDTSHAVALSETSAPSSRMSWWILATSATLVVGSCRLLLWRRHRLSAHSMRATAESAEQRGQTSCLIEALKGELFQLEIDRLRGTVSDDEYSSAKSALEETVKRALARAATGGEPGVIHAHVVMGISLPP